MGLFAATIVLSAFLLFQVQPILAKAILPWFGGSAAVWTSCMLFFQAALLAGYLYAHGIVRYLRPRTQPVLHLALLAASLVFLPIVPGAGWKPSGSEIPALRILGLLSATVGLPYVLLSSTTPLLQAWYARASRGAFPYRLFALSNAGSMLGLLSYPAAAEPLLSLRGQSWGWSAAYAAFCLLCAATALAHGPKGEPAGPRVAPSTGQESDGRPGGGTALLWALLPACASTLLLAVTSHLTQNVAAVPFLWILPLTLYLLSFILCFSGEGGYRRGPWLAGLCVALAGMAFLLSNGYETARLPILLPVYSGGLFAACMVCHGELSRLKPHPRYLTGYYLLVSAGGAAGGLFVGLLAPALFRGYHEMPLGIAACAVLAGMALRRGAGHGRERSAASRRRQGWGAAWLAYAAVLSVFFVVQTRVVAARSLRAERNFYGVLRVTESAPDPRYAPVRSLFHGTIIHGRQFIEPSRRLEPTAYYGPGAGVGLAFRLHREGLPRRLGVVGLGAGTLAIYAQPRDSLRFYEINPLVTRLAEEEFTFLREARCRVEVVHGDGRLVLAGEEPQGFDVLAVDAFSGDAIPVHLLTREAFALYFRHLKPDGVLAVHITNRYVDLKPVVARLAAEAAKTARLVETEGEPRRGLFGSTWVLVGNGGGFLEDREVLRASAPLPAAGSGRPWTDDYGNLLRALKL